MKRTNIQNVSRVLSTSRLIAFAGCGLIALAVSASGQNAGDLEGLEQQDPSGQIRVGAGYRLETDIDEGGEFSEFAARVAGGGLFPIHDQLQIVLPISYQFSHYDFSDFGGDPWENIHILRVAALMRYEIDDHWSIYGGPAGGFSAESGADFGDSLTGGGIVGFNYQASATFSIGAGVGLFTQIEDDAKLLPFITADWQFADNWNLRVGFSEVAGNGGYGLEVMCHLNEQWKVGGGAQYRQKRFRLDEDGPLPDGVGQDKSASLYGKFVWAASEKVSLEVIGGIAATGEVQLENSDGHELGDSDYDPSALIGVRGIFKF